MTRTRTAVALLAIAAVAALTAGCGREVDPFPEPGDVTEAALIMRRSSMGPVIVVFTPYPLRDDSPPDGVRAAVIRAMGGMSCSAAAFHWPERAMAERWIDEQIETRRAQGVPTRLILAGHSLGATAASETARDLIANRPDAFVSLLLTVDAVKTGRINSAAGAAGAVIGGSGLPGVKVSLAAYDSAPQPDGVRFLRHVNYYQQRTPLYHGSAMPGAENHLLSDPTGLLNHANADDFAFSLMVGDLRSAIGRGGPR